MQEERRLQCLRSFGVLGSAPDPEADEAARLAARACDAPIGLVSLVDRDWQHFKAHHGTPFTGAQREHGLCPEAIRSRGLLVVEDASHDARFARHPLVASEPGIRFYAGAPLVAKDGHALGTLCAIAPRPRTLSAEQGELLELLAQKLMLQLELRREALLRAQIAALLGGPVRAELAALRAAGARVLSGRAGASMLLHVERADDLTCALAALAAPELPLVRRPANLAEAVQTLATALDAAPPLVAGDCAGAFDVDRLTDALARLCEDASSPRLALEGLPGSVRIELRGADRASEVARLHAARVAAAHGGVFLEDEAAGCLRIELPR